MNPDRSSERAQSNRLGAYVEFAPDESLVPYVQALWIHAVAATEPSSVHRVVPDHALSIGFSCRREKQGRVSEPRLLLIGPVRSPRFVVLEPGAELVAIRLHPEWAQRLLDISPGDHSNAVIDLSSVTRAADPTLPDQLEKTTSAAEALRVLRDSVVRAVARLRQPSGSDAALVRAAEALRKTHGRAGVEALAREVDLSSRHLRRSFTTTVGMSPKGVARIIRFHRVLLATDRMKSVDWSDVAARFGYFDQAHMINDVTAFSGLSPAALHRERCAESDPSSLS
jgi:AraC-like DNA-binding protein